MNWIHIKWGWNEYIKVEVNSWIELVNWYKYDKIPNGANNQILINTNKYHVWSHK